MNDMKYSEMKFAEVCNSAIEDIPSEIKTTLLIAPNDQWFEMTKDGKTFVARKAKGRFDGENWTFETSFGSDDEPSIGFSKAQAADTLPASIRFYVKKLVS